MKVTCIEALSTVKSVLRSRHSLVFEYVGKITAQKIPRLFKKYNLYSWNIRNTYVTFGNCSTKFVVFTFKSCQQLARNTSLRDQDRKYLFIFFYSGVGNKRQN